MNYRLIILRIIAILVKVLLAIVNFAISFQLMDSQNLFTHFLKEFNYLQCRFFAKFVKFLMCFLKTPCLA